MSLIPVKTPEILFAANPAELVFIKTQVLDTVSGYPYLLLCFDENTPPAHGNVLRFEIGPSGALPGTFLLFKTTANAESATEAPKYVSGDFGAYIQSIARHLYRNPAIAKNYYVNFMSYDAGTGLAVIQIISRYRGQNYNIVVAGSSTVYLDSGNTVAVTESADDAMDEAVKLQGRVTIVTDNNYNSTETSITDLEITGILNEDNNELKLTLYELPGIAKTKLGFDIPHNAWLPLPHRKAYAMVRLELNIATSAGVNKSLVQAFSDFGSTPFGGQGAFMILAGGVPLDKAPAQQHFLAWAALEQNGLQKFFTLQDRTKLVTREQPEWLTYAVFQPGIIYTMRFTVYYSNGDTATKTVDINNNLSGLFYIPTGFAQNDLAALNPGSLVEIKYEAFVDFSPYSSEVFTYVLDTRYFKNQRYFIFQNALGFIDTLRFCGVNEYTIKRKGEITTRAVTSATRPDRGSIEMVYNEMERTFTMRTGWLLTQAEKDYLTDMLRSNYIAEVPVPLFAPDGATYFKQLYKSVITTSDTIKMWQDDDAGWALEWQMKYAHDETAWSNLTALKEYWFGTIIEFTVEVTVLAASPSIGVGLGAAFYQVEVNGVIKDWSTLQLDLTTTGTYRFKVGISVAGSSAVTIIANNITATITVTGLQSAELFELDLFFFTAVNDDYLCKRIETLYSLNQLTIWTGGPDPGFTIDKMLAALLKLKRSGFAALQIADFSFSTPSSPGYLLNDQLGVLGVTVNTL